MHSYVDVQRFLNILFCLTDTFFIKVQFLASCLLDSCISSLGLVFCEKDLLFCGEDLVVLWGKSSYSVKEAIRIL